MLPRVHPSGLSSLRLHQAPLSLWFHLGLLSIWFHFGHSDLQLCLDFLPLWPQQAPFPSGPTSVLKRLHLNHTHLQLRLGPLGLWCHLSVSTWFSSFLAPPRLLLHWFALGLHPGSALGLPLATPFVTSSLTPPSIFSSVEYPSPSKVSSFSGSSSTPRTPRG